MPSGTCTLRITANGATYPAAFVVVPNCSRDVILGMDFLTDSGAITDLQAASVSFCAKHAVTPEPSTKRRNSLRIADDHVSVPPRASLMIAVYSQDAAPESDAIVENDHSLLLDRGVSVATGTVCLKHGISHTLMNIFTEEYHHLNRGASIAFLEVQEESDVIAFADFQRKSDDAVKFAHFFDVNPALPQRKQKRLRTLLRRYSKCFTSTSKLRQTLLAKHRIITEDVARPTR